MADKLFITKAAFSQFREVSEHLDDERANAAILEAQIVDLVGFIGEPLYKRLQDDFTAPDTWATPALDNLFNGIAYTPQQQQYEVIYHGLQPALTYFAYAKMLDQLQMNITRIGPMTYTEADVADPAAQAQIKTKIITARAMAVRYQEEAQKYLETNRQTFPEWKDKHQGTIAFKFTKL